MFPLRIRFQGSFQASFEAGVREIFFKDFVRDLQGSNPGLSCSLKGPSTQIAGFQGPKTIQSMDFGT